MGTSVYFDYSIDDNAPSNVSAYVPVKTEYTAINRHDSNEEDLTLVEATDVTKATSGNNNNNDYTMFQFVYENMTTSDHYDNNVHQDVPSTTPFYIINRGSI